MITRYFNADIDDATRIYVVEAEHAEDFAEAPECENAEIQPDELPADFHDWKRYSAHCYAIGLSTVYVDIRSREGD